MSKKPTRSGKKPAVASRSRRMTDQAAVDLVSNMRAFMVALPRTVHLDGEADRAREGMVAACDKLLAGAK